MATTSARARVIEFARNLAAASFDAALAGGWARARRRPCSAPPPGVGLSRALPLGASRRAIRAGDLVNVDIGLNLDGYHADMARTYVLGSPTEEVVRLGSAVRFIQDACLAAVRPGARAADLFAAGRDAAREAGVLDAFQGYGETRGPYIGHGLGLEIDEPPVLGPGDATIIAPGMVFAIEPKLISPSFGAVNLEDDVVVTPSGWALLSTLSRTMFRVDGSGAAPEPLP